MKRPLSLVLIVTAASTLAACSSDEGDPRPTAGAGGTGTGTAGTGAGGTGTAGTGTGGTGTAGTGAGGTGGAPAASFMPGPILSITPTPAGANIVDESGNTGISGGAILAQSTMAVAATTSHRDGALCMSGTTAVVVNMDYGTYWGAEVSVDLKLVPAAGAATPAADAGADAGAVALVREPWPVGNVAGFSFKLEAQDAAGAGIPPRGSIRFKALPDGADPALVTFCNEFTATSGATIDIPMDQITWECWAPGNPSLAGEMINTITAPGATLTQRPNPRALQTISWQVASNITTEVPFDFCISEVRPLYAAP